jgi:hypothetical protein
MHGFIINTDNKHQNEPKNIYKLYNNQTNKKIKNFELFSFISSDNCNSEKNSQNILFIF